MLIIASPALKARMTKTLAGFRDKDVTIIQLEKQHRGKHDFGYRIAQALTLAQSGKQLIVIGICPPQDYQPYPGWEELSRLPHVSVLGGNTHLLRRLIATLSS